MRRIYPTVASKCKIRWIPATLHNTGQIDHCQVYHGSLEAILMLDTVDVEEAYCHIAYFITVYNDIFNLMDGVMRALAKKKTQWKEDFIFTMKLARQKLSKHYAEVTSSTGHQQKIFPSGQNGSVGVDTLGQSQQGHPGGGLLRARRQFNASHSILRSDRCYTVSSCSVGLLFKTITLALWSTVTIRRNAFIRYTVASALQCAGWRCENLSSRCFYLRAKCNSLFTNYTGLQGDGWCCENLCSRSFYLRAKCNSLFTDYTGLQGDGWRCENLSSRFFYLRAKCNSLFTNYTGLQGDGWRCENISSHSFYAHAKCNSLLTNYTHHSKSPDLCGYWQSIVCSIHLLSY